MEKKLKTIQTLNNTQIKNLNISDISSSDFITITKDELETFLKEWSAGYQNVYDADWDEKSLRIVQFLGLDD